MSAAGGYAVRVTVTDAWDTVTLAIDPATPVGDVKREALRRTLGTDRAAEGSVVKFRGGPVLDETHSLATLGVPADGALIVLPGRRHPVR